MSKCGNSKKVTDLEIVFRLLTALISTSTKNLNKHPNSYKCEKINVVGHLHIILVQYKLGEAFHLKYIGRVTSNMSFSDFTNITKKKTVYSIIFALFLIHDIIQDLLNFVNIFKQVNK